MPFRFTWSSRSPSICSLSLEHQQAHSVTPNDCTHYCIHMRVTLGEGRGNQTPPSHKWNGLLIADILQEACPGDHITKPVVLALGEAILFFGRHSHNDGLHFRNVQDVELGLRCSITWAMENCPGRGYSMHHAGMLQSYGRGCYGEENKGQRARASPRVEESHPALSFTCNIDYFMWGLGKGASDEEVWRIDDICACGQEWSGTHAQHVSGGGRWHRWQRTLWVPRGSSRGLPSSGGGRSDEGSNQSFLHLTMMRTSRGSSRSACAGRGLWVKVNLPDEKAVAMECGHLLSIWSGWLIFITLCLLLIEKVPRQPS